jgi:hypothetical protein
MTAKAESVQAAGGPGRVRQAAIFRAGARGRMPSIPTDAPTLERRAPVHSSSPWIRRSWVGARRISTSARCRLSVDMASRNTHLILASSRSFGIDLDQPRVVPKPSSASARFVPWRRYLGNIPAPSAEICDPLSPEPPLRHSSISTQTRGCPGTTLRRCGKERRYRSC